MNKVIWKGEYSVGIDRIDNQHKKLFEMLNILIENKKLSVHSKIVSETLTKMLHYSESHFATEEKYMEKIDYHGIETHKKEHRQFLKKTAHFCYDTMEGNEKVPVELLTYLQTWLVNHILKTDMKLQQHVHKDHKKGFLTLS